MVVGADRVAANGDTANKIGTYQLAITARHHGASFFVAVKARPPPRDRAVLEMGERRGSTNKKKQCALLRSSVRFLVSRSQFIKSSFSHQARRLSASSRWLFLSLFHSIRCRRILVHMCCLVYHFIFRRGNLGVSLSFFFV